MFAHDFYFTDLEQAANPFNDTIELFMNLRDSAELELEEVS